MSEPAIADPVTVNFDDLADSTFLTDQFGALGVTFENAIVSTWGVSIDPFEHELPASGLNVLSDFGGPINVLFAAAPIYSFSGVFNYSEPLTVSGYLAGEFVSSVSSAFGSNLISSLNPGNEVLGLSGFFDEVRISGIEFGGFTVDDLTFDTEAPEQVPEPATLALTAIGGVLLLRRRRAKR